MANYLAAEGMASSPSSVLALDLSGHGGVRKEIEAPPPAPAPEPDVLAAYTKRWDAPPAPSPAETVFRLSLDTASPYGDTFSEAGDTSPARVVERRPFESDAAPRGFQNDWNVPAPAPAPEALPGCTGAPTTAPVEFQNAWDEKRRAAAARPAAVAEVDEEDEEDDDDVVDDLVREFKNDWGASPKRR